MTSALLRLSVEANFLSWVAWGTYCHFWLGQVLSPMIPLICRKFFMPDSVYVQLRASEWFRGTSNANMSEIYLDLHCNSFDFQITTYSSTCCRSATEHMFKKLSIDEKLIFLTSNDFNSINWPIGYKNYVRGPTPLPGNTRPAPDRRCPGPGHLLSIAEVPRIGDYSTKTSHILASINGLS